MCVCVCVSISLSVSLSVSQPLSVSLFQPACLSRTLCVSGGAFVLSGDSLPVFLVPNCSGSHSARPSDERIPPSPAHGTTTLALTASELRGVSRGHSLFLSCPSTNTPAGHHLGHAADCASWLRWLAGECRPRQLRDGRIPGARAASGLLSAALSRHYRAHSDLCLWVGPGPSRGLVGVSRRDAAEWRGALRGLRFALCLWRVGQWVSQSYAHVRGTGSSTAVCHAAHRAAYSGGCVDVYTVAERGWKRVGRRDVHCESEGKYSV
uniref:Uncharacterized protein n=1 Tax=Callorhinchus milii TaxID=7868 RepID=A0A4W3ISP3_CALMI